MKREIRDGLIFALIVLIAFTFGRGLLGVILIAAGLFFVFFQNYGKDALK